MSLYRKVMIGAITVIAFAFALTIAIPRMANDAGREAAEGFAQGVSDNSAEMVESVSEALDEVLTEDNVDAVNTRLQDLAGGLGSAIQTLKDSVIQ